LSWNSSDRAQQGHRTVDLEPASVQFERISPAILARDASKSPNVIIRKHHLVLLAALIALGSVPVYGIAPVTVSGVVTDSSGAPVVGAEVELLRPDLSVIASVLTNNTGRFAIRVLPGRYALKAMGETFLPSLRENVRVRTGAAVSLTLNTLYEAMQWLPSEPRNANSQKDDWKWTLRAAANRPLLRWLEDGPLVVVSDGSGAAPKLKARLVATGREGTFGESGERVSMSVEDTPSSSRELLAQVDFDPGSAAGMESMLGFRQDLGFAGSVDSVAAVAIRPELEMAGSEGLDEAAIRSEETINLGDMLEAEAGSTQVLARFSQNSPNTIFAALPFATVAWRDGNSALRYRMATSVPSSEDEGDSAAQTWLPRLAVNDGKLTMEHGLHQEIGWERGTSNSDVAVLVYADRIDNPVLEAHERSPAGSGPSAELLGDPESGLVRTAGKGFSASGVRASFQHKLPGNGELRASYATGEALAVTSPSQSPGQNGSLANLLVSAHPRRAQTYSISLSGTLDGSGTRWRATYRWQPETTVTPVAQFSQDAAEPFLNMQFRQPIYRHRDGPNGLDAWVNLRNMLAQGYRPYVLADGSVIVFAEAQRGLSGGLAFSF